MPLPIITVAQMREWEQATWTGGQTEAAVIARVGEVLVRFPLLPIGWSALRRPRRRHGLCTIGPNAPSKHDCRLHSFAFLTDASSFQTGSRLDAQH